MRWLFRRPGAQNMSVQPVLAQPPGKIRVAKPILGAAGRKASAPPSLAISGRPSVITAGTYAFSLSQPVALEDMSSGTTRLIGPGLDDNASTVRNIGFDFWFDGAHFTQFSVNANGLMRLGASMISTSFDNASLSTGFTTTNNAPKLAPYYDDLWIGTNGRVHFKVTGTAPNRKLVVEWLNMTIPRQSMATTGAGTFQVWLFETTGVISFVYGDGMAQNFASGGYTVGLQSGAATNFASVSTLDTDDFLCDGG